MKLVPHYWSFQWLCLPKSELPQFGMSLFSPSINLGWAAGDHTVCNTDYSLLLELLGLQPESAESRCCHPALRLVLISSTSCERRKQWGRLGPQNPPVKRPTLPPLRQQGFSIQKAIIRLLPSHDSCSLKDHTHTNIYEESVRHLAGQAVLPPREQRCRGTPLKNLCVPYPLSNSCLDQLRPMSTDEYDLFTSLSTVSLK